MGSAFLSSTGDLVSMSVIVALLIGTGVGLVGGLLPGLSGVTILTVMIPFVYHMSMFEALALLLSCYAVFTITGDITTTLVGIPSHPECAALVMDGYPMTRRGDGARALGASIFSCGVGALIGCVALALIAPQLEPLIVGIGEPQLFALLVVGLAMVGSLSGKKAIAGVVAAAIGVLLGTVGSNSQTGIIRYGFGQVYLLDGIPLVAFTLGLFAIPAVISMHVRANKGIAQSRPAIGSDQWAGVRDVIKRPSVVVRGSLVGTIIGVVPGMGGAAAQWAAYGQAAQTSRHPEEFGQGAIDGVIAPSAACNAKEGGSLLPTIAFGVPGSAAMAILLGVFTIIGVTPGPALLGSNLDITYFMVWMLVLANCVGCILCFALLKPIARVAFIPGQIVAPVVICLLFIGAASAQGQWGDVITMLVAGGVGYLFRWAGWTPIPLVVGFILGPSMENSLSLSVNIHKASWLTDPTVIVLLLVAVAIVVSTSLRRRGINKRSGGTASMSPVGVDEGSGSERVDAARSAALALLTTAVGVAAILIAFLGNWPEAAFILPLVASSAIILLSLAEFAVSAKKYVSARRAEAESSGTASPTPAPEEPQLAMSPALPSTSEQLAAAVAMEESVESEPMPAGGTASRRDTVLRTVEGAAWLIGTAVAVYVLGFTIGLPLFVLAYAVAHRRNVIFSLAGAAAVGALFYFVFIQVLNVVLPFSVFSILSS